MPFHDWAQHVAIALLAADIEPQGVLTLSPRHCCCQPMHVLVVFKWKIRVEQSRYEENQGAILPCICR
jgi:hypothetical protein